MYQGMSPFQSHLGELFFQSAKIKIFHLHTTLQSDTHSNLSPPPLPRKKKHDQDTSKQH